MQVNTIQAILKTASDKLAVCSDSAKLDAKVLLAHVINKDTTYLFTWADEVLEQPIIAEFEQLLTRRLNGEPIAYITGTKEFWSLPFFVAPSTLIPRPDTETLVELVLDHVQQQSIKLLDLGTGTGAIALALASEQPNWQITALDFNPEAVALAKKNAENLKLTQVTIAQSNWYSALSKSEQPENNQFDVIVSNPPYIDENDKHLGEGDVRFEPNSALVANNNGYADIEHIISQGRQYLNKKGSMYLEHGFEQGKQVRELFSQYGYQQATTVQDLAGNDRITWAILSN